MPEPRLLRIHHRPPNVLPKQSAADVGILRDGVWIIKIHEAIMERRGERPDDAGKEQHCREDRTPKSGGMPQSSRNVLGTGLQHSVEHLVREEPREPARLSVGSRNCRHRGSRPGGGKKGVAGIPPPPCSRRSEIYCATSVNLSADR